MMAVVTPVLHADPSKESQSISLGRPNIEGGKAAPASVEEIEVEYQGQKKKAYRFTLQHRPKAYNSISFGLPAPVDATKYNTLTFLVKAEGENSGNYYLGGVRIRDTKGNWNGTGSSRYYSKQDDGWYLFQWDMVNQPDNVRGFNHKEMRAVTLHFQFGKVPENQPVHVIVMDMQVVSGKVARAGNPELFAQWKSFLDQYKPDYSDSSKYLQPPAEGRIAQPIALTRSGRTEAVIHIAPDAADPVKLAAEELQLWLSKITGATLPIVTQQPAGSSPVIHLGAALTESKFADDVEFLKDSDGFAVRASGKDVYIFGATDKGTLNGVFAFLEGNTDIIWPRARQELSSVYTVKPDLDIVWADVRSRPVTRLRGWATNLGQRAAHEVWSYRNRLNYPTGGGTDAEGAAIRQSYGAYVEYGGGHNLHFFISKSENPERFHPVMNGQRVEKLNIWKHQLCFTHPDLPGEMAKNAVEQLRTKVPAGINSYNIKIEDNWGLCTCERCMTPITLADGRVIPPTHGAFRSTQFFTVLNEVTRLVRQEFPTLTIGTYAYFFTATPPLIDVNQNIRIYFCPYVRKDYRSPLSSPINDHWWRQLERWAKKSPNVVIREYYGIMQGFRPISEVVAFDLRSYVERGVLEYTSELNSDERVIHGGVLRGGGDEWDWTSMEYWVINRLYWDPYQDVEQLRKYYIRRTYHEAAPQIEKFYGDIRASWYANSLQPGGFIELPNMVRSYFANNAEREKQARELLEQAQKNVRHPMASFQVQALRYVFDDGIRMQRDKPYAVTRNIKNPNFLLGFGWGPPNRWGRTQRAWTEATYLPDASQGVVEAVRFTIHQRNEKRGKELYQIGNTMVAPMIARGGVLKLTIRSADPDRVPLKANSFKVQLQDQRNRQIAAPESAITVQADGSVRVEWTLDVPAPVNGKPVAFDFEKLRNLNVSVNQLEVQQVPFMADFYLSHWDYTPPATETAQQN